MAPTAVTKKSSAAKVLKRAAKSQAEADDIEEWKKAKQLLKPKDQLELNELELKETIGKQLVATNNRLPDSLIEFSYAQGTFIPLPSPGNMVVSFESQGTLLHKESQEAYQQMLEMGLDPMACMGSEETVCEAVEPDAEVTYETPEPSIAPDDDVSMIEGETQTEEGKEEEEGAEKKHEEKQEEGEEEEGEGETVVKASKAKPAAKTGGRPRKLTNQFNFCERAALTYNNPTRSQETQTIPPPMANFSANVLQWVIYDAYQEDFAAQQLEKELERERKEKEKMSIGKPQPKKATMGRAQLSEAVQGRVLECWKVLERMINQNTFNDIAKDYRYWDDPSDEYRDEEGTLLPLWKFTYDKTKKHTVTDIEWNPFYYDLFAVCFGFLEYMKPLETGAVCLFTLKNPSFPDYICMTDSGVMCADTHSKYPYMVVIGLYDGSVEVWNVHATCSKPAYRSNSVLNKHRGIVW
ncbi:unnamed protein product, partial [Callosobruchus maculatus]